jgi:hypothetical protein
MPFISKQGLTTVIVLSFATSVVSQTLVVSKAFAEEEKKAEGEEKAEGGEAKKSDGADREWAKRTTHLNVLEAKIKELNTNLGLYIKAKNGNYVMLDEKNVKIDVIKKIGESYKELVKSTEDYNKAKDELTYRYPEEGALIERKYVPMRVQTLEQIEKETGLNGDLTRTKEAIDKKYEVFTGEKKIMPDKRVDQPESTLKDTKNVESSPDQPQRLKLSQ